MEVDGGGGGGVGEGGGGVSIEMEKKNMQKGNQGKAQNEDSFQLEILEKTYAMETYPSEALRAELSVKLGLTDRQLQMWFCHRRLKDRKPPTEKRQKKSVSPSAAAGPSGGNADEMIIEDAVVEKERGSGLSLFENVDLQQQQQRVVHKVGSAVPRISSELPSMRRFYEPPLAISEQRAIAFVEAQLGEPLREDGPILGMEFDPLPPGAFGAPIVASGQHKPAGQPYDVQLYENPDSKPIKGASRALLEYQFLPEKPSARNDAHERAAPPHYYGPPTDTQNARVPLPVGRSLMRSNEQVSSGYSLQSQMPSLLSQQGRQGHHLLPASGEVDIASRVTPLLNVNTDAHYLVQPLNGLSNHIITPDRHIIYDEDRLERKRKTEEARIAKEVEAHEKRIKKELEKQDILRRKKEEQMRKEMERQDRERRKEEERLLREKQREEERYQREQRREMERREKFLQKEYLRAEKLRLKEEMRREKEAAKLKAANDRAAARRIAKESTEIIEDERLELMELAALSRGLSSILALDAETLQNLDMFKDKLPEFPPKSANLKKPFRLQPWTDSEENVGCLLMVWRFLINFADVLGLWPFTLDEFTQAFHDCDPRLLGEIHIALLRSIIKDIEDVARTATTALIANQNPAVMPGGGHPHIVEGAYAWGFDLLSWQRHLTPLTWPEVLRQFALSAGFGPKLKKRSMELPLCHDEHEGNDGENVVSNLRSGVAAENAVSIMQERGFSNPRRSRHRLTPGTVKFAAFHVLSFEGSKKSGLRDLTTSKTPEASISAALSRDTKLFERTAPSTYCVRSPYRKNSTDAEAILSAAREKIRLYQNGNVDGEAEDVEKEDAERDQDSDSDAADDPDVDDLDAISKLKEASHSSETTRLQDINCSTYGKETSCSEFMETPTHAHGTSKSSSSLRQSVGERKSNGTSGDPCLDVTGTHSQVAIPDQEDSVIDECGYAEPWVQGLTEGEYADLSIEERLNALVALIGVANEGNNIRIALEERLEAANALKKQMWAEAQLDKRRMKEENTVKLHYSSLAGHRAEQNIPYGAVEDRRNPLLTGDIKDMLSSTNHAVQLVDLNEQQNEQSYCSDIVSEKNPLMQEFSLGSDNLLLPQSVYAAEKSRSELKALIGYQAEQLYVYRSLPLGQDRRRNRYWQFITSPSQNDPGSGRIFVELCNGSWRLIDSEEGFDALVSSLDIRGIRESHLYSMLRKIEASFKGTTRKNLLCTIHPGHAFNEIKKEVLEMRPKLDSCSSNDSRKSILCSSYSKSPESSVQFPNELEKNETEENELMDRCKDVEKWMWEECFNSNKLGALNCGRLRSQLLLQICNCCHDLFSSDHNHCPSCHRTYSISDQSFNFPEHVSQCKGKVSEEHDGVTLKLSLPPRVRLLKAQLATIEASIPSEALESVWSEDYRKSWGMKLHMASTAEELLQNLTLLENSIKSDFLSANYETTWEILSSRRITADSFSGPEEIAVLPWIPPTTPAVALQLMELDSSIYYTVHQKESCQKDNQAGYFAKGPLRSYTLESSINNVSQAGYLRQDNWVDLVAGRTNLRRGRGRPRGPSRTRGGKSLRKAINSQDETCRGNTANYKFGEFPGWKGRPRGRGGRKKGRRSIRRKQKPDKGSRKNVVEKSGTKRSNFEDTPGRQQEEWNLEEIPMEVAGAENVSSSGRSEFEDDNSQASADEYDDISVDDISGVRNGKSRYFTAVDDYKVGGEDDGHVDDGDDVDDNDEYEGDDGENEQRDFYVDGYFNSDFHEEENQPTGVEHVRDVMDRGSVSSSSDYSY
ncbi:Homeobox-DDT domain protein RLT2 [Sesamum alatum]|uniref:Homeobox-DDT domain protein RLT2 n=1 Tax=Sesamum alatum TaxID=300844 RepID=A0AAE2CFT8_9LAMI|nr:Homeobox-DDT domain protein RLT2 [Sesamum alatum]